MNPKFVAFLENLKNKENSAIIDSIKEGYAVIEGLSFALGNDVRDNTQLVQATDRVGELVLELENLFADTGMSAETELMSSLGGYLSSIIKSNEFSSVADSLIDNLKLIESKLGERYPKVSQENLAAINQKFKELFDTMLTTANAM